MDGAFTINNFCEHYGIGRTLTYELLAEGKITAKKVGSRTLIERSVAERWFASQPDYHPERQK